MFHHEDKLKDLKVDLMGDSKDSLYSIDYKNESVAIRILNGEPTEYSLMYNKDVKNSITKESFDCHQIIVGAGQHQRRHVYHFATPDGILPTLRCGYTFHIGDSTWSSTPHPFELNPEEGFEEVFLYLLKTSNPTMNATAIQVGAGMWEHGKKIDEIWQVNDRDISAIPMGYHPVVGEPGVHVSYIWAYLAKKKNWEKI